MGQAQGVVMSLMRQCNMPNKSYQSFTDNFYTKPALAEVLLKAGTLLTRTQSKLEMTASGAIEDACVGGDQLPSPGGAACHVSGEKIAKKACADVEHS